MLGSVPGAQASQCLAFQMAAGPLQGTALALSAPPSSAVPGCTHSGHMQGRPPQPRLIGMTG